VLEGGGSVTDMPRPKSYGPTSTDSINEQKAKDAVAHGSGPLSKTTTSTPEESQRAGENNNKNSTEKPSQNTKNTRETPAEPQNNQIQASDIRNENRVNVRETFPDEHSGETQQTATTSLPFRLHNSYSGHGALYWGFTIAAVLALLVYVAKKFLIREQSDTQGFSKRDLSSLAAEPAEMPSPNISAVPQKKAIGDYQAQVQKKSKESASISPKQEPPKEGGRFEVRI